MPGIYTSTESRRRAIAFMLLWSTWMGDICPQSATPTSANSAQHIFGLRNGKVIAWERAFSKSAHYILTYKTLSKKQIKAVYVE